MLADIGMIEEEARACVFFMAAWQYLGDGPAMRNRALELLPPDRLEHVPAEIVDTMAARVRASIRGDGYDWIDRAYPGYRAMLDAMIERAST